MNGHEWRQETWRRVRVAAPWAIAVGALIFARLEWSAAQDTKTFYLQLLRTARESYDQAEVVLGKCRSDLSTATNQVAAVQQERDQARAIAGYAILSR
jgi:hypothetical protein